VWASGFHIPAAGKTGTTNDGTDVWFIGYTPDLVTGIWMGFDRPQKIQSNAQGGRLVAPAWTSYMSEIYQRRPSPPDWPRPDGLVVREVDRFSGLLRSPFCPDSQVVYEFYIEGTEPVSQCSGMYGTAFDSMRPAAPPVPFGQPAEINTVRPRAAPVPTPSSPPRDTAVRRQIDPFHPGKP
jgi:penicillin-binding protein 1A